MVRAPFYCAQVSKCLKIKRTESLMWVKLGVRVAAKDDNEDDDTNIQGKVDDKVSKNHNNNNNNNDLRQVTQQRFSRVQRRIQ